MVEPKKERNMSQKMTALEKIKFALFALPLEGGPPLWFRIYFRLLVVGIVAGGVLIAVFEEKYMGAIINCASWVLLIKASYKGMKNG